ncbi:MAG: hypothetical protein WBA74_06440 [Cyclobacteriaceae bacterium]
MKIRIFRLAITLFMLLSIHLAKAQQPFASTYIEQTKVGQKIGFQLGYESRDGYELGIFHQQHGGLFDLTFTEDGQLPRFYEQTFTGAFFAGNILSGKNTSLKLMVRTGAVNNFNFAITPSVIGHYRLGKFIRLHCGIGVRALRPTFQTGIRIALYN